MKEIFVFGHRNPDTDSVCSAIALSYLKNQQGLLTVPKILSDVNKESKFALDYFNVEKPAFINDVKVRIKDIEYEKNAYIHEEDSIDKAFNVMAQYNVTAVPLVDSKLKLTGYLNLKQIAKYLANNYISQIDTTLINIINSLQGYVITHFDEHIKGNVMVCAVDSNTFINEVVINSDTILISGNRKNIIERAIKQKVKLIIISFNQELDSSLVKMAVQNEVTIIKTKLETFNVASKIYLTNFAKRINENSSPVVLTEEDYYSDFLELANKKGYSNYPVVNKRNICKGVIKISGDNTYEKQEVILVDHNTFSQSVIGIEEASILEIVDHHNIGSINTFNPISFRAMPVGCTSTIIYRMFKESKVPVPKDIAGLMLSAIISDTLLFTSPTSTFEDQRAANSLALIAEVDVQEYGKKLLKAASSIEGMNIKDLVTTDYKSYTLNEKQLGISVITTMDFEEIKPKVNEIIALLNVKIEMGYDASVLFATDVIKNGSYLIYDDSSKEMLKDAFDLEDIYQGIFIPNLVSRKKQMLPKILEVLK